MKEIPGRLLGGATPRFVYRRRPPSRPIGAPTLRSLERGPSQPSRPAEHRMEKREWEEDLDELSISREAEADIKPRVPLPEVGESVRVTFLSEPWKVRKEQTRLDWDMFVADVDDGTGESRQMICPKSVRQHLSALLHRGDLERIEGSTVVITAEAIDWFETREGAVVPHAKVYRVALPAESR